MKLLFIITILFPALLFSQNKKSRELIDIIQKQFSADLENQVVPYQYIPVIEGANKEDLFNRSLSYLSQNFRENISINDREGGLLRIAGTFLNVYSNTVITTTMATNTTYILQVEVRDGRAKILVILQDYQITRSTHTTPPKSETVKITSRYPISPSGLSPNFYAKAFFNSHNSVMKLFIDIEKALQEEESDW